MKKLLILLVLFCSVLCHAQQQNVKIYLNNGRIVSGELQEETSTTVTIVKSDGVPQTINKVEIRKIADAGEPDIVSMNKRYVDYTAKESGFWGAVELGGGLNLHIDGKYDSSVMTDLCLTGGYRFNKFIQAGVGAGVRYYISGNDRVYVRDRKPDPDVKVSFPVYANFRGIFVDDHARSTVPYWSANVGYTINDGFSFAPTVGFRFGSLERNHFLLGVGYSLQCVSVLDEEAGSGYKNLVLNAVTLKLGYQF